MKTITHQLDAAFRQAISTAFPGTPDVDPLIGPSQNEKFGDYQSNVAMGLAKRVSLKPREVAEKVTAAVQPILRELASEVGIAGPGFINVRLSPQWVAHQLDVIRRDERLAVELTEKPQTVVLDYSSPNIAKEMHIGNMRATVIGDAIRRVLEFRGERVIPQNHVGDWGTAFGMLLAYLKENADRADAPIKDIEQFYKAAKKRFDADPAFANESRQAVVRLQSGSAEELARWQRIIELSRQHLDEMYAVLGIKLTRADERGESFYNPLLADVVKELSEKGIAVESEGAIVVWVQGFEAPLIVRKSDGGFGYGATDLAAVRYRARDLKADRIITLTDHRQSQHFKQFSDAARRAGWLDGVSFEHVTFGAIMGPDGKPYKTKSGETVKLGDVVNEAVERALVIVTEKNPEIPEESRKTVARAVGVGAIKYYDMVRDRATDYVFDWEKMLSFDGNTAPYLQYANARICSIFRKAGVDRNNVSAPINLESTFELALGKHLLRFGEIIESVTRELKPHVLTTYLYDLATRFSGFFENCPVIQSDEPVRASRLALCDATARTLACGLDLLGIEHPEQM